MIKNENLTDQDQPISKRLRTSIVTYDQDVPSDSNSSICEVFFKISNNKTFINYYYLSLNLINN